MRKSQALEQNPHERYFDDWKLHSDLYPKIQASDKTIQKDVIKIVQTLNIQNQLWLFRLHVICVRASLVFV